MTRLVPLLLICIQISCLAQNDRKFGQGLSYISFESPIGCLVEIQSDNPNIDTVGLKILLKILPQIPSIKYGLENNFPQAVLLDFENKYRNRDDFIIFAKNEQQIFKKNIIDLENLFVPNEFLLLKKLILSNYWSYYSFNNILIKWLEDNDYEKLKLSMMEFSNNPNIISIIDSCSNDNWMSFYKDLNSNLQPEFNCRIFPMKLIWDTERDLMEKAKLYIVEEPCD